MTGYDTLDSGIYKLRNSQVHKRIPPLPEDPFLRIHEIGRLMAEHGEDPYTHMDYDILGLQKELDNTVHSLNYQPPQNNVVQFEKRSA